MSRRGSYDRRKGRSSGGFSMVLHAMQDSPAWRTASGNAVKLLLHLMRLSKGNNGFGDGKHDRGRLYLSEREAAAAIGVSRNTAARLFAELIELGFIRMASKGHFDVKGVATRWRLTFQPYPHGHMAPTNEWLDWKPGEQKPQAQKLNDIGSKTEPPEKPRRRTGPKIEPVGADSAKALGPKIEPDIDIPREGDSPGAKPANGTAAILPLRIGSPPGHPDREAPAAADLRPRVIAYLCTRYGSGGPLAAAARISKSDLSLFRHGSRDLPDEKRARLAAALDRALASEHAAGGREAARAAR